MLTKYEKRKALSMWKLYLPGVVILTWCLFTVFFISFLSKGRLVGVIRYHYKSILNKFFFTTLAFTFPVFTVNCWITPSKPRVINSLDLDIPISLWQKKCSKRIRSGICVCRRFQWVCLRNSENNPTQMKCWLFKLQLWFLTPYCCRRFKSLKWRKRNV